MTQLNPASVDRERLAEVLSQRDISLPLGQIDQLAAYAGILWAWNDHINLTRHSDIERFVSRDVWDTWHLARCLSPDEEVLDVGSGGGTPGLVLAIIRPDLRVSVCETTGKKAGVLNDLVDRLQLPVPVYHGRAEEIIEEFRFDTLVARAVGPIVKIGRWFHGKWHLFHRLLLIKGPRWVDERGEARHRGVLNNVALRRIHHYPLIGTDSESVILELRRKEDHRPSS